jgi:hypothetical protein
MSHAATKWAFDQPELHRDMKPSEWAVLMVLADCHNPVNGCFPSQDYICTKTNLGERAVRDQLCRLRERGLIDWDSARENGRRGSNRYILGFEAGFQPANFAGSSTGEIEQAQPADSDSFNRQNLPPNPVREPVKEPERGCEREDQKSETDTVVPDDDMPGRAAFDKRVMRFMSGRGFVAGPWPNWDSGGTATPAWVTARFAELTSQQRIEAERWRDAYLLDIAGRKLEPKPVGTFIRDRVWEGLDPAILDRAERVRQGRLSPDERSRPDGWAKCLGPVGMARYFADLLAGSAKGLALEGSFVPDPVLRDKWPELWQFRTILRQKQGVVFGPRWHSLKGAMEPVPQGSDMLARWKATFAERGWLWLSEFDRVDVVFCPAGGPEGLMQFEQAVRGRTDDDGGRSEAAE